jgi:2-polyprenyl-3-methyl-5-hydroxy-6-metoxy-1,4-benzoquinol methylase
MGMAWVMGTGEASRGEIVLMPKVLRISAGEKVVTTSDREREWHNRRFANGGDERAISKVRFAYSACTYAQQAFRNLQNVSDRRVLDIGCGRGIERAKQFALQGCEYAGIDISDECISANISDCAKTKLNAKFLREDANRLSALKGEKYDLIILSGTLHHLDLDKALPALAEITEENGKVIMWEPMGTNPAFNIFRMLTPKIRTPDEHPLNFSDLKAIKKFSQLLLSTSTH